jgi:hypothetical protein
MTTSSRVGLGVVVEEAKRENSVSRAPLVPLAAGGPHNVASGMTHENRSRNLAFSAAIAWM